MAVFSYKYPHPAVATDIAVFCLDKGELHIALIRRGLSPYKGKLALPGGFLKQDETLDVCAARELKEETGATARLHHFANFSEPKRDPRERVVSVAYLALVRADTIKLTAGSDAAEVQWVPLSGLHSKRGVALLDQMAFDHAAILSKALASLGEMAMTSDVVFDLLPDQFTLPQLQAAMEEIMKWNPAGERRLDKRNFRRWVSNLGFVREAPGKLQTGRRPAQLYTAQRHEIA